jgi:hypothetical protein
METRHVIRVLKTAHLANSTQPSRTQPELKLGGLCNYEMMPTQLK